MADIDLIKRNIGRMIDQGAPETDIDAYLSSEGVTPAQLQPARAALPDTALDVAKSAGIGAVKGAIGMADLPELGMRAAVNIKNKLFGPPPASFDSRFNALNPPAELPAPSQAIQAAIEKKTGPFYEPQTYPGQWAQTFGEFAPNAIGGGGGLVRKGIIQVAIPALTSEAAGAVTKGTAYEPYARAGAAIISPVAAERTIAGRIAPTTGQLKQAYKDVVQDPAFLGTPLGAGDPQTVADAMRTALYQRGHDILNSPTPFKRADIVEGLPSQTLTGSPQPTVGDLQAVRQRLSADERAAAGNQITGAPEDASRTAKRELDRALGSINPDYADANKNYAIAKTSEYLQGKRDIALNRAAAANSGKNIGNTLRQRMVDILASGKARANFTPDQINEVERIAQGSWLQNQVRDWANRLGGGGGLGQTLVAAGGLGGAGYYAGGEEGAGLGVAAALAGKGLKGIENAMAQRKINNLDRQIRLSAPGAPQGVAAWAPAPTRADIARALARISAANQEQPY